MRIECEDCKGTMVSISCINDLITFECEDCGEQIICSIIIKGEDKDESNCKTVDRRR